MSHPTCHLLSLLSQKPGPSSSSACSPPRAPWPLVCSLPARLALASASAEGLASSGLGWSLCALAPWWGLGASLGAASAHGRPLSLSGKPRRLGAAAPAAGHRLLPTLAWPGLASDPVPDATGSGSGRAGPRGPLVHMLPRRALAASRGDRVSPQPGPHGTGLWWCLLGPLHPPPDLDFRRCLGSASHPSTTTPQHPQQWLSASGF